MPAFSKSRSKRYSKIEVDLDELDVEESDALIGTNEYFYEDQLFWKTVNSLETHKQVIRRLVILAIAIIIAVTIFLIEALFPEAPAQRRCLALLVFVAILWVTGIVPIYVTSLMIPMLVIYLEILVIPGTNQPVPRPEAAKEIIYSMFSSTVLVAISAFTMSMALMKYELSYRLAALVLTRVGKNPKVIVLVIMLLGLFLSMWISNVASPTVCISLMSPLLLDLPDEHRDYGKVILLGIAYANNIGGMPTPIASPQNLVALNVISEHKWNTTGSDGTVSTTSRSVGWGEWLLLAIPFSLICTVVSWAFLWCVYRPNIKEVDPVPPKKVHPLNKKHFVILITCLVTILGWSLQTKLEPYTGSIGITALIPIIVFFGWGILEKSDLKELAWDIVLLLCGGLALGHAIQSCGLLAFITQTITKQLEGVPLVGILLILGGIVWFFGNFTSHTVASIVMLPLIAGIGCTLGDGDCDKGHYRMLVIGSVLLDSGAMALPVSSFPNAQTYSFEDRNQKQFLTTFDFVKTGWVLGIFEVFLLATLGYGLESAMGW